ncbi:hypothetical protein Phum_PHUM227500 [Pediculus humanus corporis]|uniref:C2HC/C3H-type domain-containing protein n=1 Tax=Pediculus humanus subsp. corporis TaxID=121224 RepID=E0VIG6_PEDHC|nr:uncharacterized protein Phum_PHUM227500 [Pediculus humanus corporis]EEB13172.1 hypothetical protein Phum_PHUM227500 [Pediculus humanus corporis]
MDSDAIISTSNEYNFTTDDTQTANVTLVSCSTCNRKFFPNRLVIHEKICKNKRKPQVFDIHAMRIRGTVMEKFKTQIKTEDKPIVKEVQCPTCSRTFNPEAAGRHIPICAKKVFKSSIDDNQYEYFKVTHH